MRSAAPPPEHPGGPDPGLGVVAGARPSTLASLAALVLAAFTVVEGGLLALGLLVTHVLARGAVHRGETAFEPEVLAHRTPLLDHLTRGGTLLGATTTVIALTAVGCVVLTVRGHGPRLPAFLVLAVAGETVARSRVARAAPAAPADPAPGPRSPDLELSVRPHRRDRCAVGGLALGLARTRPGHRLRAGCTTRSTIAVVASGPP